MISWAQASKVIPSTFGATLGSTNYQKIDAKGFEVELGYNGSFGNSANQFNYQVNGNFGFATTKIIQVDEAENLPSYWSAIGRPVWLQTNGTSINQNGFTAEICF